MALYITFNDGPPLKRRIIMKRRTLLLSITTLALTLSLIAGATFALFTDSVTFENHLQAGTLDVTLTRTNLVTETLDSRGFLTKTEDSADVDFSDSTDKNVFNITPTTLIVPGSTFNAELELANNSTVAFNYYIEIVYKGGSEDLAKQLKVTANTGTETSAYVKDGITLGSQNAPLGTLVKGGKKVFTVKVVFENLSNNNDAQGKNVQFDLIVHAIQATTSA